ncbi:hypothetical protein HYS47_01995 [Candidatus Woesearchaeota archaeon]|nr:hypothetical protein [Candidatus Woesearchaeota archaeon]
MSPRWIQNSCLVALSILGIATIINLVFSRFIDPVVVSTFSVLFAAVAVGYYYGTSTVSLMPSQLRFRAVLIYSCVSITIFLLFMATGIFPGVPAESTGWLTGLTIFFSILLFAAYALLLYWLLWLGSKIGMAKTAEKRVALQRSYDYNSNGKNHKGKSPLPITKRRKDEGM